MNLNTISLHWYARPTKPRGDSGATSSPITNPPIIWAPNRIGAFSKKIFLHFDVGHDIRDLGPFFLASNKKMTKQERNRWPPFRTFPFWVARAKLVYKDTIRLIYNPTYYTFDLNQYTYFTAKSGNLIHFVTYLVCVCTYMHLVCQVMCGFYHIIYVPLKSLNIAL